MLSATVTGFYIRSSDLIFLRVEVCNHFPPLLFGHTMWLVGSYFQNQGLNSGLWQWKRRTWPLDWQRIPLVTFHKSFSISPFPSPCRPFFYSFFLFNSTYKWYHEVFVFLWHVSLNVHQYFHKWQDAILSHGWVIFHYIFYIIYTASSLSIHTRWLAHKLFPYCGYCE